MPIPQSKEELLKAIISNFDRLYAEIDSIPAERVYEMEIEGHVQNTKITPHNLLSYLLGWQELVLKWVDKYQRVEEIDFPEVGYQWNELGKLAQKFYADYENLSYEVLKERLSIKKAEIIKFVESQSNAQLYGQPWYGKHSLGRMIQFNTSSPYENARKRVRRWKRSLNEPDC